MRNHNSFFNRRSKIKLFAIKGRFLFRSPTGNEGRSVFEVPPKANLGALVGDRAGINPQTVPSVEVATAQVARVLFRHGISFQPQVRVAQKKCEQFHELLKCRVNFNCVVILKIKVPEINV